MPRLFEARNRTPFSERIDELEHMFKPQISSPEPARFDRIRSRIQIEDVLLFGWLIAQPVLFPARVDSFGVTRPDLLLGLVDLAALLLAAACLGARSRPGVRTGLVAGSDLAYAVGPLFGAVAFALDDIGDELGLGDEARLVPIMLAVGVAVGTRFAVAPLGADRRRALVTPFILATSGFFGEFLGGFSDLFDLRFPIAAIGEGRILEAVLVLGLALLSAAVFYVMLVFAPRQIAVREGTALSWTVRFLVFILGLSIGTTLASVLGRA